MISLRSFLIISSLMLTACATQKAIKETTRQFNDGQYGWAVYTGTIGVTVAAIYDVFTLGGTSDIQDGYNTVSTIANKPNDKSTLNQLPTDNSTRANLISEQQSNGKSLLNTQTGSQTDTKTNSNQISKNTKHNVVSGVNSCLERDTKSNSLADFVINKCSFPIEIKWVDSGDCKSGCGDGPLNPGSKSSVTKARGIVTHAVCPSSYAIRSTPDINANNIWTGQKNFFCVDPIAK